MKCQFSQPTRQGKRWLYACDVCDQLPVALPFEQDPARVYRVCQSRQGLREAPPAPRRKMPKPMTPEEIKRFSMPAWWHRVEEVLAEPGQPPRNALEVLVCIETCEKCPGGKWNATDPCKLLCEYKLRAAWQYGHCPAEYW